MLRIYYFWAVFFKTAYGESARSGFAMSCELSEMSLDYILIRTYFINIHFEPNCIARWSGGMVTLRKLAPFLPPHRSEVSQEEISVSVFDSVDSIWTVPICYIVSIFIIMAGPAFRVRIFSEED